MKKLLFLIPLLFFTAAPVIADDIESVEEEVVATEQEEVAAEEVVVVTESAVAEPVKVAETIVAARAATAPAARGKTPSAARISMVGAIRSSAAPAPLPVPVKAAEPKPEPVVELDCSVGEFQKGNKCVACDQKNNPGVKWENEGKDCKISCISSEYMLIDEDKEQPKCLQKCDVWGGTASREWNREKAEFSFCGAGKFLECRKGFSKTWERTASSGIEHGHCALEGTMTGKCNKDGQMKPGKLPNGQCMQVCENGFWSGCTLQRFCEKGFYEDMKKDVFYIKDKKDTKATAFECVK
ncbi:MAG: hypothetical protein FWE50_03030 [Alphaproteobacteria bacterium]|nr:hypothetical protein [Alphaproteobacteria bacterium]